MKVNVKDLHGRNPIPARCVSAALCLVLTVCGFLTKAQYPIFGREIPVAVNGYSLDAMEPALSADGNALFFNSLNDGVTTSLYYAGKVNDSTFNLVGAVPVVNQTVTPRLDGVPSLDTANNFYWVSTRQYPTIPHNLHRIRFHSTGYSNYGRVYGDFYKIGTGWIIMDASISHEGNKLLYCNALFDNCTLNIACISTIAMAEKINDSTFNKLSGSEQMFASVNDTSDYIVYAPHLSKNGLELYYSRLLKSDPRTEVLVAVRNDEHSAFTAGSVIDDDTLSEAPVLSADGNRLYYHKKTGGRFSLVLRYRQTPTGLFHIPANNWNIYPNPTRGRITCTSAAPFAVYNIYGEKVMRSENGEADLSDLPAGLYLAGNQEGRVFRKIVKE